MTWKRCIALVLCALYLSATVGTALASLTCKCLGMKAPVAHLCTGLCHAGSGAEKGSGPEAASGNSALAGAENRTVEERTDGPEACCDVCPECALRACCGCELHSIEINLYTASHSDDSEKYIRCIVAELPPSMAAECPCPAHVPALRRGLVLPPEPVVREIPRNVDALRAPPVLA